MMELWKHPKYYMGASWPDYYVFLGQHRDSDKVTRSNFRVAMAAVKAIEAKYPDWKACPDVDNEPEMIVNPYESHCLVGHVEWIGIHKNAPQELIDACNDMLEIIENYDILNDSDHSELEWTETMDYWDRISISERLEWLKDAGISCFAARHDLSVIMQKYKTGRLWEHITQD